MREDKVFSVIAKITCGACEIGGNDEYCKDCAGTGSYTIHKAIPPSTIRQILSHYAVQPLERDNERD